MPPKNKYWDHVKRWIDHPATFVREVFQVEPYPYQEEALESFPHKKRIAMKANKGPGKSAVLAMLIWNFMLRQNAQVICTSITGDNLKDGLWKELGHWYARAPVLKAMFAMGSNRIESKASPEIARNWFVSARTWPKTGSSQEQADALAGFHSDYCLGVIDEAGGVPDSVMAAIEAVMAGGIETKVVIAGNPTHREGPLFRACTTERHLWHVIEITGDPDNPKRAARVPIQWAREQIEKYGRDNPYVLVNVFGQFPPASFNALIGDDDVRAAMRRFYRPHELEGSVRVMGIDVARSGDDLSVIARRHGLQMLPLVRRRNVESGFAGASLTSRLYTEFGADGIFLDSTGGFGATWADPLQRLGLGPIPVHFNSKSNDVAYYNKRAQMYFDLVQWIKAGGAISPADEGGGNEGAENLLKALVNTTYTHKGDALILEDKDDVKGKIGFSPDEADAAALTFADKIQPKPRQRGGVEVGRSAVAAYRPFADLDRMQGGGYNVTGNAVGPYDPFRRG